MRKSPSSVTAAPCHLPYPFCHFVTFPPDRGNRPPGRGKALPYPFTFPQLYAHTQGLNHSSLLTHNSYLSGSFPHFPHSYKHPLYSAVHLEYRGCFLLGSLPRVEGSLLTASNDRTNLLQQFLNSALLFLIQIAVTFLSRNIIGKRMFFCSVAAVGQVIETCH